MRHSLVSPPFSWGDHDDFQADRKKQLQEAFEFGAPWGARHPHLFTALHYIAGIGVFSAANWIFNGAILSWFWVAGHWLLEQLPMVLALIVIFLFGAWFLFGFIWLLGEVVHQLLINAVRYSIDLFDFIERRTADGGVGIIGFVLIATGFVLQLAGTIAGAGR